MADYEAWLVFLILVVNVVGELQRKRTLAASRGFLAAAQLSCYCYYCAIVIVLTAFICTCLLFCIANLLFSYSANSRKCVIQESPAVAE